MKSALLSLVAGLAIAYVGYLFIGRVVIPVGVHELTGATVTAH